MICRFLVLYSPVPCRLVIFYLVLCYPVQTPIWPRYSCSKPHKLTTHLVCSRQLLLLIWPDWLLMFWLLLVQINQISSCLHYVKKNIILFKKICRRCSGLPLQFARSRCWRSLLPIPWRRLLHLNTASARFGFFFCQRDQLSVAYYLFDLCEVLRRARATALSASDTEWAISFWKCSYEGQDNQQVFRGASVRISSNSSVMPNESAWNARRLLAQDSCRGTNY